MKKNNSKREYIVFEIPAGYEVITDFRHNADEIEKYVKQSKLCFYFKLQEQKWKEF
jgi:hypothetical protein